MEHATGDYFPLLKNQVNLLTVYGNSSILIKRRFGPVPHIWLFLLHTVVPFPLDRPTKKSFFISGSFSIVINQLKLIKCLDSKCNYKTFFYANKIVDSWL